MKPLTLTACLLTAMILTGCVAQKQEASRGENVNDVERNCWTYKDLHDPVKRDAKMDSESGVEAKLLPVPVACELKNQEAKKQEAKEAEDAKIGLVRPVAGMISAIANSETKVVTLNIGSNQGIAVDDFLSVRRDGHNDFGSLIVTSVKANEAEAKISYVQQGELVNGDKVFKDTTISISHSLVREQRFDPIVLAQRHAELDLELGIQRILYFGKGAARGNVRIDEESGLRLQMNGGCIVSPELQSFTREYNRLMRAAAKSLR